ncbi:hypothetical protein PR048_000414 [Dryococelus australis]|uniref:Uncharacterized protein n=1 Tax=Dryococelus australis TaxID=614101 RepID=A0ABQ9IFR4_9NEOP|nr:hypothetical protein PR048_000414 [Dryococelus australis]
MMKLELLTNVLDVGNVTISGIKRKNFEILKNRKMRKWKKRCLCDSCKGEARESLDLLISRLAPVGERTLNRPMVSAREREREREVEGESLSGDLTAAKTI